MERLLEVAALCEGRDWTEQGWKERRALEWKKITEMVGPGWREEVSIFFGNIGEEKLKAAEKKGDDLLEWTRALGVEVDLKSPTKFKDSTINYIALQVLSVLSKVHLDLTITGSPATHACIRV